MMLEVGGNAELERAELCCRITKHVGLPVVPVIYPENRLWNGPET
jgi:hypothetical protein